LLERYAQADASYRRAAELAGDDPELLVNLARTQLRLDKRKEAMTSFQQAMALRPELAEKYRTMAITLGSSY
jgi:Flp pilus assembly protein TadD